MRSKNTGKWLVRTLPLLVLLGACATGTIREKLLTLPVIEGASYVGMETCAGCHEDKAAGLEKNVHGRLADFELMGWTQGCESCHGAGSLHVAGDGDTARINQPAKLPADQSAAICAACHTAGSTMDWAHSEHALADLACSDCHTIHGDGVGASLKAEDPELCYGCHQEEMAKASFPSHHPIKEGKMTCSDCHNPHGELQTDELARDLCLECHARYTGPFVFEHAPVEEDCNICHDPHGTVANNLLQQNEPFLCLQCHESHFHAARIGPTVDVGDGATFDANELEALRDANADLYVMITSGGTWTNPTTTTVFTTPGSQTPGEANALLTSVLADDPSLAAVLPANVSVPLTNMFGEEGWRKAFLTKCTTCHGVVHGSDLPSQSAPVIDANGDGFPDGGFGLTR